MDRVEALRLALCCHHEQLLLAVDLDVGARCDDDELVVVGQVALYEHAGDVVQRVLAAHLQLVGGGIADA